MKKTTQPLKILIAEDAENDFKLVHNCLNKIAAWQFDIKRVVNYDDVAEALNSNNWGLCICNNRLGSKNCLDLIDISSRQTPVIILAAYDDCETEMLAIKAGAFDFLAKASLSKEKLERSIFNTIERNAQFKKLQESEKKFKTFFEKFHDILFITDKQYRVVYINYAVQEILEYKEESCAGKLLTDFFYNHADAAAFTAKLTQDGGVNQFEAQLFSANGAIKVCSISASVETDSYNENYIHGTIRDVTNTKQVQKAYIQSEKHAASGRFIFTLAHELRNPLNNIKLAVENLLPAADNGDDAFFLNIIQRNGDRINNLVTELLDSSRPADITCEELSLHELLNSVTGKLSQKLQQRNIKLITHYDKLDVTIKADPVKLETAILNMIENAMEAVKNDTGLIELTTVYHNNQLTLFIKDNGLGISDDYKDKIFEPYFTSKRNGIGLGLAKALNILESHQAKTEVYSKENEGTTFSIQFAL